MFRILIHGDLHLTSREVTEHRNYAEFSLYILKEINNIAQKEKCNLVIGLGDFGDCKVTDLRYISKIHNILKEQAKITRQPKIELVGNHDKLSDGYMSLSEYFTDIRLIAQPPYIDADNVRLHLVNYGEENKHLDILKGHKNIVLGHNKFNIKDYEVSGEFRDRHLEEWLDVDLIISGHIHIGNEQQEDCDEKINKYRIHKGDKTKLIDVIHLKNPTHIHHYNYQIVNGVTDVMILEIDGLNYNVRYVTIDIPQESELFETREEKRKTLENELSIIDKIR